MRSGAKSKQGIFNENLCHKMFVHITFLPVSTIGETRGKEGITKANYPRKEAIRVESFGAY